MSELRQQKLRSLDDIDALFREGAPPEEICDDLVTLDLSNGAAIEDVPSAKVKDRVAEWKEMSGEDLAPDLEAARHRAMKSKPAPVGDPKTFFQCMRDRKNPYKTEKARTSRESAAKWIHPDDIAAANNLLDGKAPQHNIVTHAAARTCARNGFKVVDGHALDGRGKGTGPGGQSKIPRGPGWRDRGTDDLDAVDDYWIGNGEFPEDSQGQVRPFPGIDAPRNLNLVIHDGHFVLDEDGEEGKAEVAALEVEHGELPPTVDVMTGSGGRHRWFRCKREIKNTACQIGQKVDVRGIGGQVVGPSSVHPSGNFYIAAEGRGPGQIDIPFAPEWLEELAFNASKANGGTKKTKPKAKPKKNEHKKAGGPHRAHTGGGWQKHRDDIGDGEGQRGFHAPINETACAYFAQNGVDADAEPLKDAVRAAIDAAYRDPAKSRERYDTDEYLDGRIEGAREYIAEQGEDEPVSYDTATLTVRIEAAGLNKDSPMADIRAFFEELLDENADVTTFGRAITLIEKPRTALGKRELSALLKKVREAHRVEERTQGKVPVIGEWDDPEMVTYAEKKLSKAKDHNGDPAIYVRHGDYGVIKDGNIEMLDFSPFKARLDDLTEWSDGNRSVFSPKDVAQHLYHKDGKTGAELTGVKKTAYFNADWQCVFAPGYDASTGVYLDSGGLDVPSVSKVPSEDEVTEAKRLFVEEVFGDFPIGGLTRDALVPKVMGGEPVPDFANLMGMNLQPFCRDGIDGPTPLYLLTKPTPGTGASLVVDVSAEIATGDVAPPQPLPTNAEELEKTMLAIAISGVDYCNFDNLNMTVSGGALASNLTARKVRGRLLSTSRIVEAPVRNLWVGTANNVEASREILRRIVMIEMDAHMAHPETRSGWRHKDIMAYVKDNRGRLVWAALTLIQNWIAKGRPTAGVPVVNSYENWSRVIGGILKAAGIGGFLGNQARKLSYATSGSDNNAQALMQHLWDNFNDGQMFRPGGTAEVRGYKGHPVVSLKDELNHCGEEGGALLIDGYGYSKDADGYVGSKGIAKMFRKAARAPWEVEGGELTWEEHPDPQSPSQVFWIMRKRVV